MLHAFHDFEALHLRHVCASVAFHHMTVRHVCGVLATQLIISFSTDNAGLVAAPWLTESFQKIKAGASAASKVVLHRQFGVSSSFHR
jgi:hypothetical protein